MTDKFTLRQTKPDYNVTFSNDGREIGRLDFNGPEMVFTGKAAESAKVFFDYIAAQFSERLEEERKRCSEAERGANAPAAEPTLAVLEKQLAQAEFEKQAYTDALRYRKLRELYRAVDFSYGDGYEKGEPVLIFRWPVGMRVSANLDATLDAAMSAQSGDEESK